MSGVREHGIVVGADPTGASVRIRPASVEHCTTCGACCAGDLAGSRLLRVPSAKGLTPGARVVVETSPVSMLSATLLLLLVPLIGLIAGATLGTVLREDLGLGEETGPIVGGLLLMAVAYLGVSILDRRIRDRQGAAGPRIVEVTPRDDDAGDPLDGSSPIG